MGPGPSAGAWFLSGSGQQVYSDLHPWSVPTCEFCPASPDIGDNLHGLGTLNLMDRVFITLRVLECGSSFKEENRCTCSLAKRRGKGKLHAQFRVLSGPRNELFGHVSGSCVQKTWQCEESLFPSLEGWGISFVWTPAW